MSSNNVLILKQLEMPSSPGVHYRLVCLTGSGKGQSFYLKGHRVVIGRGETADIQIMDTKASREHAELTRFGATYVVTDLKSQNGIMVNDLKVAQHVLKDGDKVIIGSTVFKFGRVEVADQDVEVFNDKDQKNGAKEESKSHGNKKEESLQTNDEEQQKKAKRKKILIIAVIALSLYALFDDSSQGPVEAKRKGTVGRVGGDLNDELATYLEKKKQAEDKELQEKLDEIFHRGLRELREGNYYRAINEFNLAFILSPNNARAMAYKDKAKQMLDNEVQTNMESALREIDALRYSNAVVSYCSVIRLLQNSSEDKRYKEVLERLSELEKKLGMNAGEIKCL